MSHNFRSDARKSLELARKELAAGDDERLRHAELRMCVEAITYDRAEAYKDELPPEEYETWQPAKLLQALLVIDPTANSAKTIAFGKEDVPGEPAKEMHVLGTDTPLTLKVIKYHYDALGNFLHVPTLKQIQNGNVTTPEKVRQRCEALVIELDATLNSTIFNSTIGQFSHIDCMAARNRSSVAFPTPSSSWRQAASTVVRHTCCVRRTARRSGSGSSNSVRVRNAVRR